ncbi:MAG: type II CRISPR RNA-guided endonuclease Cas9 [Bacteroidota bacterium]
MKKILGLDIGTTSIGWAIVEAKAEKPRKETETDINNERIGIYKDDNNGYALGVRIIKQDTDNITSFNKGEKLNKDSKATPTALRRQKRGARRLKSRYKLRRDKLIKVLEFLKMLPDGAKYKDENNNDVRKNSNYYTNAKGKRGKENDIGKALYQLRNKAITEKINPEEWGRLMLQLNQYRGYSSDRFKKDENTNFGYYTCVVKTFDLENKEAKYIDEKAEKKELKYYKIKIKVKLDEYIDISENSDEQKLINEFEGFTYINKIDFKEEDLITIKKPELKQDKKGKNIIAEYWEIKRVIPKEEDWKYRYQTLHKTLTEWCDNGGTVGSYFYKYFYDDRTPVSEKINRIRANIVNRDWYEKEFVKIFDLQFQENKNHFEKYTIEDIVKVAFKDYQSILNDVKKHSNIFSKQLCYLIKDKIIFFQRPWQQAKNKGNCPFEKVKIIVDRKIKGTEKTEKVTEYVGRTVIPKSHPLYQEYRMWQQINNVRLFYNTRDEKIDLFEDDEKVKKLTGKTLKEHTGKTLIQIKDLLYDHLQRTKTMSLKSFASNKLGLENVCDVIEDLKQKKQKVKRGVNTDTGEILENFYSVNYRKQKKDKTYRDIEIHGNKTLLVFKNILPNKTDEWFFKEHHSSKDNHNEENKKTYKDCSYSITNLQLLWELIFDVSIQKKEDLKAIIVRDKNFNEEFTDEELNKLVEIKFDDSGMGDLSAKSIRNLLPLMSNGTNLTEKAARKIKSISDLINSKEEKEKSEDEKLESIAEFLPDKKARLHFSTYTNPQQFKYLNYWQAAAVVYGSHSSKTNNIKHKIEPVKQHSMNNPIVEKIVNETISIVNEIKTLYGFDEVRIELSRELKASADERAAMDEGMRNNATRNELAKRMLRELFNADVSSTNLTKLKVYEDEAKFLNKETFEKLKEKKLIDENSENKRYIPYEDAQKEYNLREPSKANIERYKLWLDQKCQCPYTGEIIKLSDVFTSKYEKEHIIPKERYPDNSYSNFVITRTVINKWKDNHLAYEFIIDKGGKTITDNSDGKKLTILNLDRNTNEGTYKVHVENIFPKGRKLKNLLRKEVPEDPINRELKDTQYINKKLKEKLAEIVGYNKVWTTTGAVTDILRESWSLNEVMKEILRPRYKEFKISLGSGSSPVFETINYKEDFENKKINKTNEREVFPGYSKRYDHRHHILDAIIVASTKQWHIQYLNTMNAENENKIEASWLKKAVCRQSEESDFQANKFNYPWIDFNKTNIQEALEQVFVSLKNNKNLISESRHPKVIRGKEITIKNKNGETPIPIAIRGKIHDETLIGVRKFYDGSKRVSIEEIVDLIFEKRMYARENLLPVKSFEDLINTLVFKERFRELLLPIFKRFSNSNPKDTQIKNEILKYIEDNKTNLFEWAYLFKESAVKTGTDKGGTIDKLLPKNILDDRIKRYLTYRKDFIEDLENELKLLKKEKNKDDEIKEFENKIKKAKDYSNLYYNALYDVRTPSLNKKWTPLYELKKENIDKIEYWVDFKTKLPKRTNQVRELVTNYFNKFEPTKENVLVNNPLKVGEKDIVIKKASVYSTTKLQNLYPIKPKTYVALGNNFMVYAFEDINKNRDWKLLSFMNALQLKLATKNRIKNENLFPKELTPAGYYQIFTLTHSDIVFIPPSNIDVNDINKLFESKEIGDRKIISDNLWIVKLFSDTINEKSGKRTRTIEFSKLNTAQEIKIPITDIKTQTILNKEIINVIKNEKASKNLLEMKSKFVNAKDAKEKNENAFIKEQKIFREESLFQNCIKVYTNKLGTKVVPYTKFKNGIWNKEDAIKTGLLNDRTCLDIKTRSIIDVARINGSVPNRVK